MTPYRHRIVAALDLAQYSEIVIEHAIDQAAHHDAIDVHVLHVLDGSTTDVADAKASLGALVLPALDGLSCSDWRLYLHVRAGKAPDEITNLAAELRAHLIVIGRFGVHHPHRRIGLTAGRVIDLAPCPTFVVGLTDQTSDTQPQCADCVEARATSDGRVWFCAAHAAPDRVRLSTMISSQSGWTGGGLMW